jgi:hypothetical protein
LKLQRLMLCGLTILTFVATAEAQEPRLRLSEEQSSFNAEEDKVNRAVPVPEGALQLLRSDEQILRYLSAKGESAGDLTTDAFLASEIHLNGPGEIDLIVIGRGRLRGANVVTFWVIRKSAKKFTVILKTVAHDLRIQDDRWNGFRNIETASPIAGTASVVLYKFDGKRYKVFQTKSEHIE